MTAGVPPENIGAAHSPLTKLVVDSIRERILSGAYEPGERLVEAHLSTELGVSRMPVREALRVLAAEGIVTIEPRRGATVPLYSAEQVRELVEVRATLEALNAKLAAKRHDPEQIRKLEQILARRREGQREDRAGADPPGQQRLPRRAGAHAPPTRRWARWCARCASARRSSSRRTAASAPSRTGKSMRPSCARWWPATPSWPACWRRAMCTALPTRFPEQLQASSAADAAPAPAKARRRTGT